MKNDNLLNSSLGTMFRPVSRIGLGLALLGGLGLTRPAKGQVYEWTDPRGVRHFSSEKRGDQFKKADLPPLLREKANKVSVKTGGASGKALEGCHNHGGINCQAGPDGDGSVICVDGFKDAAAPFRFFCFMPKLAVSEVIPGKDAGTIKVVVRNESGVAATKPMITLPASFGSPTITGPDAIAPHEVGEFLIAGLTSAPTNSEVSIQCQNCG